MTSHRVSPPKVFPEATHAAKPPADPPGQADAFRQTRFMLGAEIDAVLDGLNLEGTLAQAASGAKFRNQRVAAGMVMWSKSWLARLQALHSIEWGNYAAVPMLVRGAADHLAAMWALTGPDAAEWDNWLEAGGIGRDTEQGAAVFHLHPFRSAESLAGDPNIGMLYRAAMDLAMPHLGATVMLAAADSDAERVVATFGDRDYHQALAELFLGWLLQLGTAQVSFPAREDSPFPDAAPDESSKWLAASAALLKRSDRCSMSLSEIGGEQRWTVANFRRGSTSVPRKILL